MEIELKLGFRSQISYRIGDRYRWIVGKAVQNGGRPENGNIDGNGYSECPFCGRDFFVIVHIRSDVIEGAIANDAKEAYITE